MKSVISSLLLILIVSVNGMAQDQIILKSAEEIKGKVTEIKIDLIIYKDFDNLEGPTIELKKSDVFMIIYENGKTYKVEDLASESAPNKLKDEEPRTHHLVSVFSNIPFVRTNGNGETIGVAMGLSYEYQSKNNIFGLKLSPTITKVDFDVNAWSLSGAISPRWYIVHTAPVQFGLGIEGSAGAFLKPEGSPSSYESLLVSGHVILATNLYSASKFNGNIEVGLGYEYWKESYRAYNYYYGTTNFLSEVNLFSVFLRLSIGGRLGGK